ncbi:vWA domain-containing protein [Quadrisphaera oryzae]|uniref:vWA domain-containing protein n=1 Tax=Quadrisphaera TaxID=317661 RepID=UPI0016479852|nr:VWA domain-containing protein [Quadrisphaera sp. RL12-1S]MBC3761950.1 VWA domain-containing protein [Quadrisphaera sp. RL12-1S]
MSRAYRYGAWDGGADPLAPPYDVRAAVDAIGRDVMQGRSLQEALRDLLRNGLEDERGRREGLDALRERVRRRREQLRSSGDLAGSLQQAREKLEQALTTERAALDQKAAEAAERESAGEEGAGADASEAALAHAQLDALPRRTAAAVRELADYEWTSPAAQQTYEELLDDLRQQALRAQIPGLGQMGQQGEGGQGQSGQSMEGVKELLGDLNALLAAHERGEDTTEQFAEFMAKHGDAFPEDPKDVDELLDALAQRAAAMQRLMRSLSKEERSQLQQLMAQAMADAGLEAEVSALNQHLQDLRPGAFVRGRGRESFNGSQPLGMDDATGALAELADLDDLDDQLAMDGPGQGLDDVDVEAVERQLGTGAANQLRRLAELERELKKQGWLTGPASQLQLSPKALRRLGQTALRRVFADLESSRRGSHDERSAGAAGEATGTWREWQFGDEQPLDAVATVRRAVMRSAATRSPSSSAQQRGVRLLPEDFAVAETERRSSAAVALCVDLSWSMYAEDRWAPMKQTAMALAHLVATQHPNDAFEIIGFDRTARTMSTAELAAVEPAWIQGTNLQHALALARRHVSRHPDAQPIVLVVTDGEPTAHLDDDGEAWFDWPTSPETLRRTVGEVDAMTRSRVAINTFLLGEDPGLRRFADAMARRNGGRVFAPSLDRLGEYVVSDYLRARNGSSGSRRAS